MAPGLAEGGEEIDGRGLLDTQGLSWTHDVTAGEQAGMLLRVDLRGMSRYAFTELLVLGIRPDAGAQDLAELLAAHRYTHGLDLIKQGTPTNATETAASPWHPGRPDTATLRASELAPGDPVGRPDVSSAGDLLRLPGADALSVALGLTGPNALDRGVHAGIGELAHAEAMNRCLWPATFGHYFTSVLGGVLDADTRVAA